VTLAKLEKAKLITKDRDGCTLTASGEKAYAKMKPIKPRQED
jgi:Mn-dependent DtxR family transcriptional regulator